MKYKVNDEENPKISFGSNKIVHSHNKIAAINIDTTNQP